MTCQNLRTCALTLGVFLLLGGCERPPVNTIQHGYRGTGMELLYNPRALAQQEQANAAPVAPPLATAGGAPASSAYSNIQVLTDLNVAELARLMVAMTAWVAPPDQSCAYCHSGANMASDDNYHKVVARQMLRMVRHINSDWSTHVGTTGVTCYTCHRGRDVPEYVWYQEGPPAHSVAFAGGLGGKNAPAASVGLTSLPSDPFTEFLQTPDHDIRVVATQALPGTDPSPIKKAEETYGLMIHMSKALGVNCTFCHNSRSFTSWDSSTPQRATAWYGIRMVRDLNSDFLTPLASTFPADRKGPLNDVAKINCQTCHQGVYKPMFGEGMLKDYPELAGHRAQPSEAPAQ